MKTLELKRNQSCHEAGLSIWVATGPKVEHQPHEVSYLFLGLSETNKALHFNAQLRLRIERLA